MPYALFSNDARLSKAYPTETDVWKVARTSGLVVDVATEEEKANPHPVLDRHYEITRLLLLLLFVLLAPVTAQAGVAEQSLTRANAKVRAAVLHDVCEVHGNEKRDQLDAEDRAAYASILKELQRSLDTNDDPEVATQTFCEFGRGLQKPPAEPHKP